MQNSATRMRSLIDDLLKFSRVGSDEYTFEKTNLNSVLNNVIDDLHISIKEKSAEINIEELPTILGEKNKLYQVFLNLLSNGLKFSKAEQAPVITISCQQVLREEKEYWQININDNGIGFEQKYAEKMNLL